MRQLSKMQLTLLVVLDAIAFAALVSSIVPELPRKFSYYHQ